MKINFLKTLLILVVVLGISIVQSCKNPCKNVNCVNGACVDGTCICSNGYTGADCSTPPDPCLGITCVNGDCVNGVCVCDTDYTGVDCSEAIDPCQGIDCNNGVCLEGICICEDGWDGTDCNILIRSLFVGIYNVQEICNSDPNFTDNYVSTISESTQGVQYITIDNIYNFGSFPVVEPEDATVIATVSAAGGDYVLLIDTQTFSSSILSDFQVSGSGTYNVATSEITISYTIVDTTLPVTDPNYSDNCTQIYTPQ